MRALKATVLVVTLVGITIGCQQQTGQTEEEVKALATQSLDFWNTGDFSTVDDVYAPTFVRHDVDTFGDFVGVDAYKAYVSGTRTSYPDFNITFDEIFAMGDRCVVRWTITATNTGPRGELPPTGKEFTMSGASIHLVADGKIVEEWVYFNHEVLITQLGYTIIPPSAETVE